MVRYAVVLLTLLRLAPFARADDLDDQLAWQLVLIVRDPTASTAARVHSARALGKLGPKARAVVPELIRLLPRYRYDELRPLQLAIIISLGEIGHPARPALPVLALEVGRSIDIDLAAKHSFEQIIQAAEDVDLPTLLRQLRHRDESFRLRAAKALGKLGPVGKPAVSELIIALSDSDADVRRAALASLHAIEPTIRLGEGEAKVHALDLQDPDPANRLRAVKALAALGAGAEAAIPALQAALEDRDADVRRAAGDVLSRIPAPR